MTAHVDGRMVLVGKRYTINANGRRFVRVAVESMAAPNIWWITDLVLRDGRGDAENYANLAEIRQAAFGAWQRRPGTGSCCQTEALADLGFVLPARLRKAERS